MRLVKNLLFFRIIYMTTFINNVGYLLNIIDVFVWRPQE